MAVDAGARGGGAGSGGGDGVGVAHGVDGRFAMRSLAEQDVMATTYGATLASFARPQSPVCADHLAVVPPKGGVAP